MLVNAIVEARADPSAIVAVVWAPPDVEDAEEGLLGDWRWDVEPTYA
ncbi:hypothetical protein [Thermomonospora umbrina]|uniref:Uncharacterized protein n=1 Tax=Thermomonospora umbrina TaxID=111806 RepID=A0A3D9SWI6_9ACTN|nr:hypothetical protein [Thermomonospora umbrina]REF00297.1 hypothetical protein DFJ69_5828 [Thermomonospora umbrina]